MLEWWENWDWRYLCAGAGVDDESDEPETENSTSSRPAARPAAVPAPGRPVPARRAATARLAKAPQTDGRPVPARAATARLAKAPQTDGHVLLRRQGTVLFHKDNILEAARTREQVDHLLHPEDVPRHCTDVAWLVTYAILLSALVAVCLWYAKSSPLLRLSDYEGTVCGIGKTVDTPMAYVCSVNLNGLQTAFTV
eukprot:s5542_g1.t1